MFDLVKQLAKFILSSKAPISRILAFLHNKLD